MDKPDYTETEHFRKHHDENGNRLPTIAIKVITKDGGHWLDKDSEPFKVGFKHNDIGHYIIIRPETDLEEVIQVLLRQTEAMLRYVLKLDKPKGDQA